MQTVDLHSHSQHSDGRLSVRDLVASAHQAGITTLALTDHDTTAGIADASRYASDSGMNLVPGVEISVSWRHRTVHILGLGIDAESEALQQGLQGLRDKRQQRAELIHRKLVAAGIDGALPWVQQRVNGGLISRTHFAEFLVDSGYAKDMRGVFKRYLVSGKPGHVSIHWCDLAEALTWIHGAGGVAVIAHPARYKLSRRKLIELIEDFIDCGGQGLEVVSSSHNEAECRQLGELASQYHLYASCGSDFHSPDQPWARLGHIPPLPSQCTPVWTLWSDICKE